MDYGYQLLRHVFAQVFGNLPQAARITLVLLAAPMVVVFVTNPGLLDGTAFHFNPDTGTTDFSSLQPLGALLTVIVGLISWLWAAVAWHRYVLLEEYPNGLLPRWRGSNIANYFGNALLILLVMIAVALLGGIVVGIFVAVLQSPAIIVALGIGLIIGVSWMATRVGLVLPAAAIGERLTLRESWAATAPVSGQIILPIIVIALVTTILNQGIVAVFGTSVDVMTPIGQQQQVTLSAIGVVLSVAVGWAQMLVNLALMTTLYGNLIEGRQLN
ncbi:hypothetical protein [Gymnodinialimonas ceratoperidinii]|uniref:Glycerophosphoryl diester phosphodiesterase membrane domain-containing protein n=1 Tax=Gymnodinialimonas ceratoperidinii TaxID=2856823 RepID=A0A8F6YD84_9RHOB|nr:hypothetical protein [Gymnodinialimonas ceratoperidinii]QXT39937.1 hypothetical protein KYE46_01345 [Gymnodinialimonas ceratoperidinii]